MKISKSLTSSIIERDKSYWKCELCNGELVYEDDVDGQPSWLALKSYCEEYNVSIRKVWVCFRDREVPILSSDECLSCQGVVFIKSLRAYFGSDHNSHYYKFGRLQDDNSVVFRVLSVPELEIDSEQISDVSSYERLIIWNGAMLKS